MTDAKDAGLFEATLTEVLHAGMAGEMHGLLEALSKEEAER